MTNYYIDLGMEGLKITDEPGIQVTMVIENGISDVSGIEVGDKLLKVNDPLINSLRDAYDLEYFEGGAYYLFYFDKSKGINREAHLIVVWTNEDNVKAADAAAGGKPYSGGVKPTYEIRAQ